MSILIQVLIECYDFVMKQEHAYRIYVSKLNQDLIL